MNGNDAGVAANVSKLIIVGSWKDLASEAAHESHTCKMEIMVVLRAR